MILYTFCYIQYYNIPDPAELTYKIWLILIYLVFQFIWGYEGHTLLTIQTCVDIMEASKQATQQASGPH